jgi:hypothetical protein
MDDASAELSRVTGAEASRKDNAPQTHLSKGMPSDYTELVRRFGAGSFCQFLWLLEPGCSNENLDLDRQTVLQRSVLRTCAEQGEDVPPDALGESPTLVAWAISDNGDVVWWRRQGKDQNNGTVVVSSVRPLEWEEFDMSCSRFLLRFVEDELASQLLPNSVQPPRFEPWIPSTT